MSTTVIVVKDAGLTKAVGGKTASGIVAKDDIPKNASFISLPHPVYDFHSKYMIIGDKILEVSQVEDTDPRGNPHSWFLGHTVVADGSLFIASPVNPIFLALPFIQKACAQSQSNDGCYIDLSQTLSPVTTGSSSTFHLAKALLARRKSLQSVFDTVEISNNDASNTNPIQIRYNSKKLIHWLQYRVSMTALKIAQTPSIAPYYFSTPDGLSKIQFSTFSHSKNLMSENGAKIAQYDGAVSIVIQYALEMIGEWVSNSIFTQLLATYSLEAPATPDNIMTNHIIHSPETLKKVSKQLSNIGKHDNAEDEDDHDDSNSKTSSQPIFTSMKQVGKSTKTANVFTSSKVASKTATKAAATKTTSTKATATSTNSQMTHISGDMLIINDQDEEEEEVKSATQPEKRKSASIVESEKPAKIAKTTKASTTSTASSKAPPKTGIFAFITKTSK